MYQRAAVFDSQNLNAAFFNKKVQSGGAASGMALDVVNKIKNLHNGKYAAIIVQYDTWNKIPESFVEFVPPRTIPPTPPPVL